MAEPTTIIGEFTSVEGNLQGGEDLQVFGRVEGSIQLEKTLLIETSGVVKADVSVRNAVVSGVVIGNIEASESVRITAEGRMVGDIAAPRVIIVEGALFRGRVDMGEVKPSVSRATKSEPTLKQTASPRDVPRPTVRPARTTEPARPSRIRPSRKEEAEDVDDVDEVEPEPEPEPEPKAKPMRHRPTSASKPPPKVATETGPKDDKDAKPPPPKPRVAPRKRRVSVKKR